MSAVYDSLMLGLTEAVVDAGGGGKRLPRQSVVIEEPLFYQPRQILAIRRKTGLSREFFAAYLGVSPQTVAAWELGRRYPGGAARRLLRMLETSEDLLQQFPFVQRSDAGEIQPESGADVFAGTKK